MAVAPQLGIPYGDRPLGYAQGVGVFATPDFLQFLERLLVVARSVPGSTTSMQAQIDDGAHAVAALTTTTAASAQTMDRANTRLLNRLRLMASRVPQRYAVEAEDALALTSGVPATLLEQLLESDARLAVGVVSFTGPGVLAWGRASLGMAAAAIEPGIAQSAAVFVNGSPMAIGIDPSVSGFVCPFTEPPGPNHTAFLNVEASFSGNISAYGGFVVLQAG